MPVRTTHTFAELAVPHDVYASIRKKLVDAQYDHAFCQGSQGEAIDMTGLALVPDKGPVPELHGSKMLILYFANEADQKAAAAALADALPHATAVPV